MLATVDDLKKFLNKEGHGEDSLLEILLDGVSAALRKAVGSELEPVTVTEYFQPSPTIPGLVLSNAVIAVQSVTEATTTVASTDYRLEGRVLHKISGGQRILWPEVEVAVQYRAGYRPIPTDLKLAAIEQAAFEYKQAAGTAGGDRIGLTQNSPEVGSQQSFAPHDLLPGVKRTARAYRGPW